VDISDFDYDEDNFEKDLTKFSVGFSKAKTYFFERVDHWKLLIDAKRFNNILLNEDLGSNQVTGQILGKQFALRLSPITRGDHGLAAVLLTLKDPVNGKQIELDRFNLNVNGEVVSSSGETLLKPQHQDETASIRLFYAILLRVMKAEPWA